MLLVVWKWVSTSGGHLAAGALAIVAAFGVGSWVSARIAGNYQTKNTLRGMRSTWINDLREDLASFASYAHKYDDVLKKQKRIKEENERLYQLVDEVTELRAQKNRLAHQVIMRLNPFEEDHIKLTIIVQKMNSNNSILYRTVFRRQAQKVLKREWDVVRNGPMSKRKQEKWAAAWDKNEDEAKIKARGLRKALHISP